MTEKSIMWTTGSTGDGASPYTQAEAIRMWRQMMVSDNTDECVHKNYGNELEVTGTSTPVAVDTGAAVVYGFPYWNTASVNVAIPTPSASTRVDLIVLEADWTAQTVRITRVAGTEGAGAPSLTQSDGVTWQIKLAEASITTGGVITVTDYRVFLHPNIEIETAMIAASAVTTAKIADDNVTLAKIPNRTRRFFVTPRGGYTSPDYLQWSGGGYSFVDNKGSSAYGVFTVPDDFASGLTVKSIVRPLLSGNAYIRTTAEYGADGESPTTHSDVTGYTAVAVTVSQYNEAQSLSVSSAASGDHVVILLERDATHASDTVNASLLLYGFLVTYTADS